MGDAKNDVMAQTLRAQAAQSNPSLGANATDFGDADIIRDDQATSLATIRMRKPAMRKTKSSMSQRIFSAEDSAGDVQADAHAILSRALLELRRSRSRHFGKHSNGTGASVSLENQVNEQSSQRGV
ncbi:hypothetical protein PYCC9005_004239 [Savitreella phatthalungensis]